jgi:hypothetical protein
MKPTGNAGRFGEIGRRGLAFCLSTFLQLQTASPSNTGDFIEHVFRCIDFETCVSQCAFDERRCQAFRFRVVKYGRQQIQRRKAWGFMCVIDHEVVNQY